MTNASLRERLGIIHSSQASVLIQQALAAEAIRRVGPAYPRTGYVPFWA